MKAKTTIRKITKPAVVGALLALATTCAQIPASAQTTAFTYQGRLNISGTPANGVYDFLFEAFDAASSGISVGPTASLPAVGVTNGLFTAQVDLGATPFTGPARWMQISVSTNGAGSYSTLSPRQPLSPAPYSIYANTAGTVTNGGIGSAQLGPNSVSAVNIQSGTITGSKIASGQVVKTLNGLTDNVSISAGANVTLATNGSNLTINSSGSGAFSLNATNAYFTAGNVGIGRIDPPYALTVRGGADPIAWERYVGGVQSGKTWAWEVDGAGTYLRNATDGSLLLTILNGGQIGIGTINPSHALDVRTTSNAAVIRAKSSNADSVLTLDRGSAGPAAQIQFSTAAAVDFAMGTSQGSAGSSDFSIYNYGTANNALTILKANGYVGIGTVNPQAPLHVLNANGNYGQLGTSAYGVVGSAGFASPATATAGVQGTNSYTGAYGELGRHDHFSDFPKSIGVFGSGGDYAGWFAGAVVVEGGLTANTITANNMIKVDANQGYALLWSRSSANGSVFELRNDTASPTYLGAINFTTSGSAPGQIAYESDNALHFRTGGVDDRMKLNASGLYVNGTFVSSSDRNAKENFRSLDSREVLSKVAALPLTRWNYKEDTTSEHIGPMAQDFYSAFKVGPDDKHITTIDESGVALVAIQGLNQKLEQKETEITELKERLEKLERVINATKGE